MSGSAGEGQSRPTETKQSEWKGFAEVDRAIAENRFSEYRVKKAWADPWGRRLTIAVLLLLTAFVVFVIVSEASGT